jgi:hypothetical protein
MAMSPQAQDFPSPTATTNAAMIVTRGRAGPDKIASAGLGSRSFDAVDHSVVYFNPVAPLTVNGASSGAFRRPQLAQFGNVGNDSAFGPGEVNVDLALNKLFTIRERYSLQLRAEA